MFDIYLKYCEEIFGGYHKFTKNNLGYDVLNIHNNRDDFKIVLADKVRFGEYTLFHRAFGANLNGTYSWHVQIKSKSLDFLIYSAFVHDFNKYNNILNEVNKYCNISNSEFKNITLIEGDKD